MGSPIVPALHDSRHPHQSVGVLHRSCQNSPALGTLRAFGLAGRRRNHGARGRHCERCGCRRNRRHSEHAGGSGKWEVEEEGGRSHPLRLSCCLSGCSSSRRSSRGGVQILVVHPAEAHRTTLGLPTLNADRRLSTVDFRLRLDRRDQSSIMLYAE